MKKTYIYGAGEYGTRLHDCFNIIGIDVEMFIVTKKQENNKKVNGLPICELNEIDVNDLADSNIIVAVDKKYHGEIRQELQSYLGANLMHIVQFYSKENIDKLFREAHSYDVNSFLISTKPVSTIFGNDRGTPVDRYYIEKYLENESKKICSCDLVLEVGEDVYSKQFFPNSRHDILDYAKGMDLTKKDTLPQNKYDVFICTQVFQQIYDVKNAIKGAYHLLKKNGVMLATVCGNIAKLARNEEYDHYWGFTEASISKLIMEVFGENVIVNTYGNSAVATAFVQGVSLEEIDSSILDIKDKDFTICISITARK